MTDSLILLLLLGTIGIGLIIVSFILIQMRSQNILFRQRKQMDEAALQHQKELLNSVIILQEKERRRIGQNLHDDVGIALSVLKIKLSGSQVHDTAIITETVNGIDEIIADVRDISHKLSPRMLELMGLWNAIDELCEKITATGQLKAHFYCEENLQTNKWNPDMELALYRVIQELTTNTIRHAHAKNIHILLSEDGQEKITLHYKDDGRGLPELPKKQGMGMDNIVSRLEMLSANWQFGGAGTGFSLKVSIPIHQAPIVN